jgi:hypothetical protein
MDITYGHFPNSGRFQSQGAIYERFEAFE